MNVYVASKTPFLDGWLFGPRLDLAFFFIPIPLAFLLYFAIRLVNGVDLAVLAFIFQQGFLLGPFHQGATWFHFFDKKNREQYLGSAESRRYFILYPLIVFSLTVAGIFYFPEVTAIIYILWSLHHAVQQNIGILLLYHNPKAGEAVVDRKTELFSQRAAAAFFIALFFDRVFLGYAFRDPAWIGAMALFGLIALLSAAQYCLSLFSMIKQGKKFNFPAFCFWLMSIFYLAPFAFLGKDYFEALFIPLIIHWIQYIGLNYHLVQEKYQEERIELLPSAKPILLFVGSSFLFAIIVMAITFIGKTIASGLPIVKIIVGVTLGLGMVHYYLDGRIWRFREAYARASILPFLLGKRHG